MTTNAVAPGEYCQRTQCLQGRRQTFKVFALMMHLPSLRRNQTLFQRGQACTQEANQPQRTEMGDGRFIPLQCLLRETQTGTKGAYKVGVEFVKALLYGAQGSPRVFEDPALLTRLQAGTQRLQAVLHSALEALRYPLYLGV